MKCPKCGKKLRISSKNPNYGLCDNCRKRYLLKDSKLDSLYDAQKKKDKIVRQNRGCALAMIIFVAVIALIIGIAVAFSGNDKSTEEPLSNSTTVDYNEVLQTQKTALDDLIEKYESGEESATTSAERLTGLADGIQNTIDMLNAENESEDLVSYATALKGIASHYSEYITTGDQSEMDDANALRESIE